MNAERRPALAARLLGLAVFASAMGWLEAVVVVYIRGLLGFRAFVTPPAPSEWLSRMRAIPWLLPTEQGRELATLIMLASVGGLAGRNARERLGAFLLCFGVWDIVYYVGLVALVHWPTSLATVDLLFLIPPHPWWVQPVWVPVSISCAMIAAGVLLQRERATRG